MIKLLIQKNKQSQPKKEPTISIKKEKDLINNQQSTTTRKENKIIVKKNLKMIAGIGTDIVYIPRFYKIFITKYQNNPKFISKFCAKFMHKLELTKMHELQQKEVAQTSIADVNTIPLHIRYAAGVWSVKESVYKSLDLDEKPIASTGKSQKVPTLFLFSSIFYKSNNTSGKPLINVDLHNLKAKYVPARLQSQILDSKFHLSISHDKDYVVSHVVREVI